MNKKIMNTPALHFLLIIMSLFLFLGLENSNATEFINSCVKLFNNPTTLRSQLFEIPKIDIGDFVVLKRGAIRSVTKSTMIAGLKGSSVVKVIAKSDQGIMVEFIPGVVAVVKNKHLVPWKGQFQSAAMLEKFHEKRISKSLGKLYPIGTNRFVIHQENKGLISIENTNKISLALEKGVEKLRDALKGIPHEAVILEKINRKLNNLIIVVSENTQYNYLHQTIHHFKYKNFKNYHFEFSEDKLIIALNIQSLIINGNINFALLFHELGHALDPMTALGKYEFRNAIKLVLAQYPTDFFLETTADLNIFFMQNLTQLKFATGEVHRDFAKPKFENFELFLKNTPRENFNRYTGTHNGSAYLSKVFFELSKEFGKDKIWRLLMHVRYIDYQGLYEMVEGRLYSIHLGKSEAESSYEAMVATRIYLDKFVEEHYPEIYPSYKVLIEKWTIGNIF